MPDVRVYGNGRSGSAYADRLRAQGYPVTVYDKADGGIRPVDGVDTPAALAILALPRGHDSAEALRCIDPERVATVLDLTTQSPDSARSNQDLWIQLGGLAYHAGGSNGGERAVRAGYSYLLVGPRCDAKIWPIVRAIGYVSEFDTVEYATTLKLCHNAFLLIENETARFLAQTCRELGVRMQDLEKVIDDGPAGRRFGDLTAIRHLKGGYVTSYVGEYAAKDWRYFQDMIADAGIDGLPFVLADVLEQTLDERGRDPWV
jgi:3-hydroxyisobutyrate dehydrogenase-like beta-hydroxyacid dehydrogenase